MENPQKDIDIVLNICYIKDAQGTTKGESRKREVRPIATSAKAVKKWQAVHVKRYGFPVMIDTEPEVIAKLDSVPNKSKYIKDLIKADIAKTK